MTEIRANKSLMTDNESTLPLPYSALARFIGGESFATMAASYGMYTAEYLEQCARLQLRDAIVRRDEQLHKYL